jgi:hypothetical protein
MQTKDLPFPSGKHETVTFVLIERLYLDKWIIPVGTVLTLKGTKVIVLPDGCVDARGMTITQRMFKV